MADIAAVFHWPPAALLDMSLVELVEWRERAIERFKLMQPAR